VRKSLELGVSSAKHVEDMVLDKVEGGAKAVNSAMQDTGGGSRHSALQQKIREGKKRKGRTKSLQKFKRQHREGRDKTKAATEVELPSRKRTLSENEEDDVDVEMGQKKLKGVEEGVESSVTKNLSVGLSEQPCENQRRLWRGIARVWETAWQFGNFWSSRSRRGRIFFSCQKQNLMSGECSGYNGLWVW
jgi:hypothetical protein